MYMLKYIIKALEITFSCYKNNNKLYNSYVVHYFVRMGPLCVLARLILLYFRVSRQINIIHVDLMV